MKFKINTPTTVIRRFGGMGDILMLLGACKALHHYTKIVIHTIPLYEEICRRCPYVADVITSEYTGEVCDVGDTSHSFCQELHQLDTYLSDFDISCDNKDKEILLLNTKEETAKIATLSNKMKRDKRFLLHPGLTDPGRTWPVQHWIELAKMLMPYGDVIIIGSTKAEKTVSVKEIDGTWSLVNHLSFMETVALMRTSTVLISADAGPIQLAGATDIGIVGFYSLIPSKNRLPYRHGQLGWNAIGLEAKCPLFPCFHKTHDKRFMEKYQDALNSGQLRYDDMLRMWCPSGNAYECMRNITPLMVFDACMELVSNKKKINLNNLTNTPKDSTIK